MIDTIDPYESLYQVTDTPYSMRAFKRSDVEAVDYIIRIAGEREDVHTLDDWGVVAKLIEFYSRQWPDEWADYIKQNKDIRQSRARKDGYSREKGREGTRYIASLPGGHFPRLFKIIFPKQEWNREFTSKFINNIKVARVGEKIDTWFTIPDAPSKRVNLVEEAVKKLDNELNGTSNKPVSSVS